VFALETLACMSSVSADTPEPALPPPPGVMVSVDDHRLHLNCSGEGSPTVILESGLGGNSLDWTRVVPGVASFTRVCAYDRAGYGWSDLGPMPRTSLRIATELHQLLQSADLPAPYILVGHSYGGYSVRLFASRYPEETAGLVLVDASHEQQFRYLRKAKAGSSFRHDNSWAGRAGGLGVPENLPAEVRALDQLLVGTDKATKTLQNETRYFQFSAEQTRVFAGSAGGIPVTVLSRGRRVWPHDEQGDRLEAVWEKLQEDLFVRLGTSQRIAAGSGHYIQLDEPDIVIDSIHDLVRSVDHESDN
jgi:pimeloyl-ACP methyl ester carboxylesterase